MTIEYDTVIPDNQVADASANGLLDFSRLIISVAENGGIASRFHTIEAHREFGEQTDRIYLRDSKPSGNRCYVFVNLEDGSDEVRVGFGELQHSGGEPTWGEQFFPMTGDSANRIVKEIQTILK